MKLIKLNADHYVIVDHSEIREGDWVLTEENTIHQVDYVDAYTKINEWKKITHSTQPIEEFVDNEGIRRIGWTNIKVLELSEVKELLGVVDVEKRAREEILYNEQKREWWKQGYTKALEDNKDRKYTEEDMRKAISETRKGMLYNKKYEDEYIQSLQPKTEWEVEFIDGKLKLK